LCRSAFFILRSGSTSRYCERTQNLDHALGRDSQPLSPT
jgi:hypothetical protein